MKRTIVILAALAAVLSASAAFAADVMLTSVGQSPDVMMVRVVLRKMKIEADSEPLLKPDGLGGAKVLVAVVGGSSKGLGAAGIDKEQELDRVAAVLKTARDKGLKVLVMHIGGEGRRGALSDAFIEAATPLGHRIIVVDGGNDDGIFEKSAGKDVKILTAPNVNGTAGPLGETLSEWGISASRRTVAMDWFFPEGIYTIAMVGSFVLGAFALKLPIAIALAAAAAVGALCGGAGFPIRHLVEGTFGYLDTILIIASAMIFMKSVQRSGLLESLAARIIRLFRSMPLMLSLGLMVIIMIPGMITGSSTAAVLTTGALVAPVMIKLGVPAVKTAAAIAMGAIYGMIAPPVNVPAMIIGGGIDMPYVGFALPLLVCTVPLAVFSALLLVYPYLKKGAGDEEALEEDLSRMEETPLTAGLLMPVILLAVLMSGEQFLPSVWPPLGMPVNFLLAALSSLLTGKKYNFLEASREAVNDAIPVLGILMGVGMFIQIMTLVGVQGFIVVSVLALPAWLMYFGMATSIPLFGAVSAFGSASVLGVPFLLALLGLDEIMVGSALSLLAGLGDLMPPTALAGIFAAQVVGEENYFKVLRHCFFPAVVTAVWAVVVIMNANTIMGYLP